MANPELATICRFRKWLIKIATNKIVIAVKMYGPIRTSMSLNQNTDAKFVLLFTKSFTRKLRNEISQFLLIAVRMARPVENKTDQMKRAKVCFF